MKILTNLKLSFFAYCYKFLGLFIFALILCASLLGLLNFNPQIDAYIYLLFAGFIVFSFTMGVFNYSKLANCHMSTCVDRNGFYISSIIIAIIQAIICTFIFELCISLVNSYYTTHYEYFTIKNYLEFKNIVFFFVVNFTAFSFGAFIALFTGKYYKICYIVLFVCYLFIIIPGLQNIYYMDSEYSINVSLTKYIVCLSIIVVTNVSNYLKYKK